MFSFDVIRSYNYYLVILINGKMPVRQARSSTATLYVRTKFCVIPKRVRSTSMYYAWVWQCMCNTKHTQ